jgi:hypothetical protein
MTDNTQSPDVPEPRSVQDLDASGDQMRSEPVKLSGYTTEDPINSGAWEKYDQFQKGK